MITTTSPLQGNLPLKYYCFSGLRQVWWPAQELYWILDEFPQTWWAGSWHCRIRLQTSHFWRTSRVFSEKQSQRPKLYGVFARTLKAPFSFKKKRLVFDGSRCPSCSYFNVVFPEEASWFRAIWDAYVPSYWICRVHLGTVLALMWLIYSSPVSSAAVTSSPGMHLI